jgi:hypothetical protein
LLLYENISQFVGTEVLTAVVIKSNIFRDITPCRLLEVNRRFAETYNLFLLSAFTLVSCSAYLHTLKFEVTCSFETSAGFQRTTRRYIQEDISLHFPIRFIFYFQLYSLFDFNDFSFHISISSSPVFANLLYFVYLSLCPLLILFVKVILIHFFLFTS